MTSACTLLCVSDIRVLQPLMTSLHCHTLSLLHYDVINDVLQDSTIWKWKRLFFIQKNVCGCSYGNKKMIYVVNIGIYVKNDETTCHPGAFFDQKTCKNAKKRFWLVVTFSGNWLMTSSKQWLYLITIDNKNKGSRNLPFFMPKNADFLQVFTLKKFYDHDSHTNHTKKTCLIDVKLQFNIFSK